MTRCPNCNKELDSSFGPKTCPQCNTLVFVSFDGSVELPAASEKNETPLDPVPAASLATDVVLPSESLDFNFESSMEPQAISPSEVVGTSESFAEAAEVLVPTFTAEQSPSLHRQSNAELDCIQKFANSEMSDGHEGELLFDIIVEGLDTESVRRDFRDSLHDRRLQIDVDATMRSIRSGHLRMAGISAIKASVLIHRLKELPIEVSWIQRRLIEDDPGPLAQSEDEL